MERGFLNWTNAAIIVKEETTIMRPSKYTISAGFLLALAGGSPAVAQTPNFPWVAIESTSVNVGIGGQSGDGMLNLPNLGTNCSYPFKVSGFGAGIQIGISKASASGGVANMTRVSDLSGDYSAAQGEATILAGGGGGSMRNTRNNVTIELKSNTEGLNLGFGGQGMSIRLAEPVSNAPKAYVLEFGFNKDWVGAEGRAVLDQVARAWKCRYANIWLFGHTDTTGKEDTNLDLSEKRASAARDYLIGTGIVPTRVNTLAKGEDSPLVATANNVRLRSNRAVVVVIQE
jgi:outer membrane protein OmpA-like peptidoglycan-associated protein